MSTTIISRDAHTRRVLACYMKFSGYMHGYFKLHAFVYHPHEYCTPTFTDLYDYVSFAGLTGILFSDRSETAYSIVRIWQAFGFTAGFGTAELLSLEARLCLLLATVSFATLCSLVVEFKTQTKAQLLPCVSKSDSGPGNAPRNEKNLPADAPFATYSGRSSCSCIHTTITSPRSSTIPDPLTVTTLAEGDQCYYKPEGLQRNYSIYHSPSYLAALNNSPCLI